MNQTIEKIVKDFYSLATTDVMIGYHFRKIKERDGEHPLKPPLDAFSSHIPRIVNFWEVQLLGQTIQGEAFDLLGIHRKLGILPGELGRWIKLFEDVLNQYDQEDELILSWRNKLKHFETIFKKQLFFANN